MKTIQVNLYQFSELSENAKQKAIYDQIEFEISEIGMREDDELFNPFWKYAKKMDDMQTPWFLHKLIYEEALDIIIGNIEANRYDFDINGNLQ